MNSKEDELAEMQDQLEKYQALLQITATPGKTKVSGGDDETRHLLKLYTLATGLLNGLALESIACGG